MALLASEAAHGCTCDCVAGPPGYHVRASTEQPSLPWPQTRSRCENYCEEASAIHRERLSARGSCTYPPPPPLPITLDLCSSAADTHTVPGNSIGLTARRAGTSCLSLPKAVTRVRVWCHVWVENDTTQWGYCFGMGDTSCGRVSYFERQNVRVTETPDHSAWVICVDANNQHSSETRHFSILGAPY
jgi:hypothetical protein